MIIHSRHTIEALSTPVRLKLPIPYHQGRQFWSPVRNSSTYSINMPDDRQSSIGDTGHDRHFDTIVIGAGISGLACANRLCQQLPNSRIKVLEARDRIGGRINSVHKNGARLDTGANWIHGIGTKDRPNPLMDILPNKRYKQIGGGVMFRPPPKDGAEGEKENLMVPQEHLGSLMEAMWGMIGELHEISSRTSAEEAKKTTVLQAIQKSEMFRDAFAELPEEYHGILRGVPQFVENMEAGPLVSSSAEAPYTKPGFGLLEYAIDDFDGDQVYLLDGYTPIIEELARPLQEASIIETNTQVETIDWSASPVKIQTSNGTYTAKTLVLSIPLGVLKAHHTSIFTPVLPKPKQEAISSLGFGTLDKIFLVYPHAWWAEEPYSTFFKNGKRANVASPYHDPSADEGVDSFMGFTHDLSGMAISPEPSASVQAGPRILSFINLHALSGFPVLGVFVSCSNALTVENMTNEAAAELAHSNFASWLPSHLPTPPKPDGVHVTRWATDEFSLGSYSHMITGVSERRHREEFQTPITGDSGAEVRFAGEHTSSNHFATAHGALISGWREADGIVAAAGQ